jgi:hypothetical protein
LIEEERGANLGLPQEVGGEECDPLEDLEPSTGLEDEEGDGLLEEEANYDRSPGWSRSAISPSSERSELPIG